MPIAPVTYTAQRVIDHVKRHFGDESGVQVMDSDIIRWINDGQVEILNKNPVLKAVATANVVANQFEYTFPDSILRVETITFDGQPIEYKSFQQYLEDIAKDDPKRELKGTPQYWYEWGGVFNLYPTPDKAITGGLKLYYVKNPTPVTGGSSTLSLPDRYYNMLFQYVMMQAYEMDEDWVAVGNKASQFEAHSNQLAEEENRPKNLTYSTITVLDEDGEWY